MIVKPVFVLRDAQTEVPLHAGVLPVLVPFLLGPGADKKLHFHLFELPHPEDKLPGNDLIPEGFADLGDTEGDLHPARLLDVQEIHKDALRRLGAEIDLAGLIGYAAQLGREHEIELADLRPVGGAADPAFDLQVFDQPFETVENHWL